MSRCLLTINGGSSSLKFAAFAPGPAPARLLSGAIERIGGDDAVFSARDSRNEATERRAIGAVDHAGAAGRLIDWLEARLGSTSVAAIAHRVVHGGERYTAAHLIDPPLVAEITRLVPLAPQHLPPEIALIATFAERYPGVRQVACFDTAFHSSLPRTARLLPIPRSYQAAGVRRYGFHGLSYAFLMDELRRCAGEEAASGRVVLAHLGSGASLAAVREGRSVDTSMGFTATGGLMMGTRPGDLDPGLVIWLMRNDGLSADGLEELFNRRSGLMGLSETSADMRDLLARESADPRAADAVALFCYDAKKWIGALTAALGGIDTLVFSGGIGENAAPVRARICTGLDYLGIGIDESRNAASAETISKEGSRATVRVIRTDEEMTMVREMQSLLAGQMPEGR